MALSRKDYEAVAKVLNRATVEASTDGERQTVGNITADLAEVFANDNPRFDMKRFMAAALTGEKV